MELKCTSENAIISLRELPSGYLGNIIECYVFRKVRVNDVTPIVKLMPSRYSNSIDFFLGDNYDTIDLKTGLYVPFVRSTIRGPRTYKKYQISIRGNFISFNIKFKPSGLYQILSIPMDNFRDEAMDTTLVRPELFGELTERLMGCTDIRSCIAIAEAYLLQLLTKSTSKPSVVGPLAELILRSDNSFRINTFYKQLPLSARQLERNFVKEIGIPPQTYRCMVRFEKLIYQRIKQPHRKWTEIAYEHDYFDQMHFIKDFHRFLDINPRNFSPGDFAF
jgi:AraC-like DNA-binding protein